MQSVLHRLLSACACMAALASFTPAAAQTTGANQWIWMSGSSTLPSNGMIPAVYGTLGTPAAANTPGSRMQAASWTDTDGHLWLFGGFNSDEAHLYYFNDLWEFDPAAMEWSWRGGSNTPAAHCPTIEGLAICGTAGEYGTQGAAAVANWPGGRYSIATWVDSTGRFWLYGGWGLDAVGQVGILGDLWVYDPSTSQWTWMGGDNTLPTTGENDIGVYGMLGIPAAGNYPGSLTFSSSATDPNGNTWIFGGWGFNDKDQNGLPNKLWEYVQSTGDWGWMAGPISTAADYDSATYGTQGVAAASNTPSSRWDVYSWADAGGDIWIFGGDGWDNGGYRGMFNQLWEFDPSGGAWAWMAGPQTIACAPGSDNQNCGNPGVYGTLGVPANGNLPGSRSRGSSWKDKDGNFWLFGGQGFDASGTYNILNDIWLLNPESRQWAWMGGPSSEGLSGSAFYGTLGVASPDNLPGRRDGQTTWTGTNGNFWLYGGNGLDGNGQIGILNDLWEYQPSTTLATASFALSANPAALTVPPGSKGASTITSTVQNGFDSTIALSAAGQPSAVNIGFNTTGITGAGSATMTINVADSATPGVYPITITGSGGGLSETTQVTLTIAAPTATAAPDFSPAAGTYHTPVTVTLSDATPNATIYYTTNGSAPTTGSQVYSGAIPLSSTGTINAFAAAPGYTASPVASATYTIPADFSLSLNPTVITVQAGQSGTSTVVITKIGGFDANVGLACSGLPAGAACAFTLQALPTSPDVTYYTLTVTTSASTPANAGKNAQPRTGHPLLPAASLALVLCCVGLRRRRRIQLYFLLTLTAAALATLSGCVIVYTPHGGSGTYPVTVTGTSGALQHSATLNLTIN